MNKAHILSEIRRTAAANGGKPLGFTRFEAETGIRNADWKGVHWARWSDALTEAGLPPNRFSTPSFAKEKLAKSYADLARELGRLPVKDELRMKRRSDLAFPSATTFQRLGSKLQLIEAVAEYCKTHADYDDVLLWCNAFVTDARSKFSTHDDANMKESPVVGYVYLVKSGRFYKVGKTNAVGRREYELGLQLPEHAKTVHVISTDDPTGIEAYWHTRFASKRKNGEWFELKPEDVAAFKRRRFM